MSGTKQFVEQRIIQRRASEAKNLELRRTLTEHNILAGHSKSADVVEAKRRARSEAAERRELFADYSYVKSEQDKTRRTQIAHFEDHLANELASRKALQLRESMDKRRICDGSEELRALKERLHMAKVNKERSQQLLEIEVRKHGDRLHEQAIAEFMENERLEHIELEHKLNIEKGKQRERVKHINQQQIAMKEASREEAMQEYLKEKDQVEELVNKIAREDEDEHNVREEKKKESREMLQQFMKEQKANQVAQERAEQEENEAIEAYARDKRAREEKLAAEKAEAEREKTKILNAMLGKMEKASKDAEELELLRNDLCTEELEAESRRREELQVRKKLEDKEEMKNAYLFQMKMKEEKAAAARQDEEQIRAQLLKKFAEDDRLEQMSENKRRMKVEAHKREAQRLIELRREKYEQERESERSAGDALRDQESKRQVVIEEERRRLIAEHAGELKNFLPKYTLESQDDYDLMFK